MDVHRWCHLIGFSGLIALSFSTLPARASDWQLQGHAFVRGIDADSASSWRDGGFGRLDVGQGPGSQGLTELARAHLTAEWRPSTLIGAYVHAAARAEPDELRGDALGIVEAFIELEAPLESADRLRARVGHFLLPTSRENIDPAWTSPYTLSFSALNTWIGEEVRVTGAEGSYEWAIGELSSLRWTTTIFAGNDTAGTLLAWRGWALGDRLTTFDETLALPALPGLANGGAFAVQQDSGTTPFGSDLDGRVGWASTLGFQTFDSGSLHLTFYDNRGDRKFHRGEYAWATHFYLVGVDRGFELEAGRLDLVAEWMWGHTGMGELDSHHVDTDFRAGYALASWTRGAWRATVRWDDFETVDRDQAVPDDPNEGRGQAWTVAFLYQPVDSAWRWGLELLELDAQRPAAALSVQDTPDVDGRSVSLELRYLF